MYDLINLHGMPNADKLIDQENEPMSVEEAKVAEEIQHTNQGTEHYDVYLPNNFLEGEFDVF